MQTNQASNTRHMQQFAAALANGISLPGQSLTPGCWAMASGNLQQASGDMSHQVA